jgi:hypothetical protein
MKKVFATSSDVIHLWANQLQDEARTSSNNIYFNDLKEIFSYGSHYKLAHFIGNDFKAVLINDLGYSKTTSKHVSEVRQATSHKKQFLKSECDTLQVLKTIKANTISLITAPKPELYIIPSLKLWSKLNSFIDYTGSKNMKRSADYKEIQVLIKAIEDDPKNSSEAITKNASLRKKREASQRKAQLKKELIDFRSYKTGRLNLYEGKDYLRVCEDGEGIETSQRVKLTWIESNRLLKLLDLKKLIGAKVNGSYLVTSVNGTIKVGCHTIEIKEVERLRGKIENSRPDDLK